MSVFVVSMLLVFGFPFIITDVVDSFETCKQFFLKEQPPVIPGILEKSVSKNQNQYKIICQKRHEKEKEYRFATLYDTTNKIPLFSAYKYSGNKGKLSKRPNWKIEPQLEDCSKDGMSSNQACNGDYLDNQMNVNRGHLFPCSHAVDEDTAKSTFTLTNAVPQYITFNGGSWSRMEQKVRDIMNSECIDQNKKISAYVLTGAVPNTKKTSADVLNNRVNIPSHMWTVFCCFNSKSKKYESQAHWAENIDESNEKGKTINVKTLKDLQDFLKIEYKKEISLFNGDCLDLLKADASPTQKADDGYDDEPDVKKQSWWSTVKNLPADFWAWLRSFYRT